MAEIKYMGYESLKVYDALIKDEIVNKDAVVLSSAKSHSDENLITAKTYTDNSVAQKSQIQIVTWEVDD